jgi:hypothetical protein
MPGTEKSPCRSKEKCQRVRACVEHAPVQTGAIPEGKFARYRINVNGLAPKPVNIARCVNADVFRARISLPMWNHNMEKATNGSPSMLENVKALQIQLASMIELNKQLSSDSR